MLIGTLASVRLIPDGDIAGVIHCTEKSTGIDIYLGLGGAPEGVLAAAALRCIGGQIQGRLHFRTDDERERAYKAGIKDLNRKYCTEEMASGDVMFAATGVTTGSMLRGIQYDGDAVITHTVANTPTQIAKRRIDPPQDFEIYKTDATEDLFYFRPAK